MDNFQNQKPPRLVLAFFRWFCHPEFSEDIEGDLLERFHNRWAEFGPAKAKRLFIKDVCLLFRPGIIKNPVRETQFKLSNMEKFNWLRPAVIHLLFLGIIVSPFLPGPPNQLVIALSSLGQSAGFLGWLLVPIGVIWLFFEIKKRNDRQSSGKLFYVLAIIATVIAGIPFIISAGFAFLFWGIGAGLAVLVLFAAGFYMLAVRIGKLRSDESKLMNPAPIYLITIPMVAVLALLYLIGPVSEFSRGLAIEKSQSLITLIENYKIKAGHYPPSLHDLEANSVLKLPRSPVMGIGEFRYGVSNGKYNISFSQWQNMGIDEEIVLFDKRESDISGTGLEAYDYRLDRHRIKGARASFETKHANWRYYLCD